QHATCFDTRNFRDELESDEGVTECRAYGRRVSSESLSARWHVLRRRSSRSAERAPGHALWQELQRRCVEHYLAPSGARARGLAAGRGRQLFVESRGGGSECATR